MPRSDAEILEEYHRLRADYGYPAGTPLEVLLAHEWLQGAQARLLEPDVERLKREIVQQLALRAVRRGA